MKERIVFYPTKKGDEGIIRMENERQRREINSRDHLLTRGEQEGAWPALT